MSPRAPLSPLVRELVVLAVVTYLYFLFEWFFFLGMVSPLLLLSPAEKGEVLLVAPVVAFIPLACLVATLSFIERAFRIDAKLHRLVSPTVLAFTWWVVLDTYSYGFLKFGVSTSSGWLRFLWLVPLVPFWIYAKRLVDVDLSRPVWSRSQRSVLAALACVFMLVAVSLTCGFSDSPSLPPRLPALAPRDRSTLPDIVFISGDGISAEHLSLYGYGRDTSPFLSTLASTMTVYENAFPNACCTMPSLTSTLTGKSPLETRVYAVPDILRGRDSYEHLPGILRSAGYSTYEISVRYFGDPYELNMWGYDWANGRSRRELAPAWLPESKRAQENKNRLFLFAVFERLEDRLFHALGIRDMPNFRALFERTEDRDPDERRIAAFRTQMEHSPDPTFFHIHLMGTHGAKFFPRSRNFSANQEQHEPWMIDFYDDAISDFDRSVKEIMDFLEARGRLKNTILMLSSDHGLEWSCARVPLLMSFPGIPSGRVTTNVQHLDIAPTILEYLNIPVPEWMHGQSLLHTAPAPDRSIFVASSTYDGNITPPYGNLKSFSVVSCQRWFDKDLGTGMVTSREIGGHTQPCAVGEGLDGERAATALNQELKRFGYPPSLPRATHRQLEVEAQ